MFKKVLVALSIVTLMVAGFSVPTTAKGDDILFLDWNDSKYPCYSYRVLINAGAMDGSDHTETYSGGDKIFYGTSYPLPFATYSSRVTATLTVENMSNHDGLFISTSGFYDYSNKDELCENVTGLSSVPIYMYCEGGHTTYDVLVEVTYDFNVPILPNDYSHHLDGSGLGIDGNGNIFDGVIYLDGSWTVLDFPLDILADFESSSYGFVTSFNVYAPGLLIEIQGLYTYMWNNDSLFFYDWIGSSPAPTPNETELRYIWYITFSGSAGWYDLQMNIDYI